ncbi:hypothetical protein, partial [Altererythrobacter sp.]
DERLALDVANEGQFCKRRQHFSRNMLMTNENRPAKGSTVPAMEWLPEMNFPISAIAAVMLAAGSQGLAQEETTDPYDLLIESFAGDAIAGRNYEAVVEKAFVSTLEAHDDFMATEAECPGMVDGLTKAVRPIMWQSHMEGYAWYRNELGVLFRRELSSENAGRMATFFGSELGQRFIDTIIREQSFDRVVAEAIANEGESVSNEAIVKDNLDTARRTVMTLEPVDRMQITRIFATEEWAKEFARLNPMLNEVTVRMSQRNFTPEQDAAMDKQLDDFLMSHLTACYQSQ